MRKEFREAERLLAEMGFKIVGGGRSKHQFWWLETPDGRRVKQVIPHNCSEHRFWLNWRTQLRRHLTPGQAEARKLNQPK
jgi:hypothetical protein